MVNERDSFSILILQSLVSASGVGFQGKNGREEVKCGPETHVPDWCQNREPWLFLEISPKYFQ